MCVCVLVVGTFRAAGDQPQDEGISPARLNVRLLTAAPAQEETLAQAAAVESKTLGCLCL